MFTRVYIILLISAQKHRLWVLVRTATRVSTIYVLSRNLKKKNIRILSENFQVLVVKFPVYLNRHVSVMVYPGQMPRSTELCLKCLPRSALGDDRHY